MFLKYAIKVNFFISLWGLETHRRSGYIICTRTVQKKGNVANTSPWPLITRDHVRPRFVWTKSPARHYERNPPRDGIKLIGPDKCTNHYATGLYIWLLFFYIINIQRDKNLLSYCSFLRILSVNTAAMYRNCNLLRRKFTWIYVTVTVYHRYRNSFHLPVDSKWSC